MLDLPPALERAAAEYAAVRGTTLERMLVDYLEDELCRKREADEAIAAFDALVQKTSTRLKGAPYVFDRTDAYEPETPCT